MSLSFNLPDLSAFTDNDQYYINLILDDLQKDKTNIVLQNRLREAIYNANRRLEIRTNRIQQLHNANNNPSGSSSNWSSNREGLRFRGTNRHVQGESVELSEREDTRINIEPEDVAETAFGASETTPLLEASGAAGEAVGAAGAAGSATTGVGGAAAGAAITAGAITLGATVAGAIGKKIVDSLRSGFTAPGHNYLGPGNDARRIEHPVDLDDQIAKEHDLEYEKAINKDQIKHADEHAINDFVGDAVDNGNVHSIIGGVGLKAKQGIERIVGPVYPSMSSTTRRTTLKRVSSVEGRLEATYDPAAPFGYDKNRRPLTYAQWLNGIVKYIRNKTGSVKNPEVRRKEADKLKLDLHNKLLNQWGRVAYEKFFRDPKYRSEYSLVRDNNLGTSNSPIESVSAEPVAGPSGVKRGPAAQVEAPPAKVIAVQARGETQTVETTTAGASEAVGNPESPDRRPSQHANMVNTPMEIGNAPAGAAGRDNGNAGAGAASGGSGISEAVLQYYRSFGFNYADGKFSYSNSFRLRSWGNVLKEIAEDANHRKGLLTSMVALPNDHLAFYMPYSAYEILPIGIALEHISIKVTPIGQMVSFNTNSASSQVGTTAHTLYGGANIGANLVLPCGNYTITRSNQDPMEVASATHVADQQIFIERLWGPWTYPNYNASMHEIINPHAYLCIYDVNVTAQPNAIDPGVQGNAIMLNNYLTKFPMQPHTGTPIINFTFDLKGVKLKPRKVFNSNYKSDYVLYTRPEYAYENTATTFANGVPELGVGAPALKSNTLYEAGYSPITTASEFYKQRLTTIATFDSKGKVRDIIEDEMPGVFFGIEAVKANTPETTSEFINASCDYYIETFIELSLSTDIQFTLSSDLLPSQVNSFLLQHRPTREYMIPSMLGLITRQKPVPQERRIQMNLEDMELNEDNEEPTRVYRRKNIFK